MKKLVLLLALTGCCMDYSAEEDANRWVSQMNLKNPKIVCPPRGAGCTPRCDVSYDGPKGRQVIRVECWASRNRCFLRQGP
jgi:hypothetical protein